MTNAEAINELLFDKALYEDEYCHAGDGSPDGDLMQALDMAIQAIKDNERLKKENYQIRMDLKAIARINAGTKPRWEDDGWICPNCGEDLEWETADGWHKKAECCCFNCGQVIDWSEDDEADRNNSESY